MTPAEAKKFLARQRDQVRPRAVRRHPRRRQGQGRAGRASRHGARRRRGLRRLRALGLRHGAARSGLHGGRRSRRRCDWFRGCRASRASSATATSKASRSRICSRVALKRQLEAPRGARLDAVHRHRARVHAAAHARPTAARAVRCHRRARQALLRLQGPVARRVHSSNELVESLRAVGIDVYQIDHEDANGQFEVNFTYADALKSADNYMFVKMAASEIAREHGHDRHLHAQAVLEPHGQRRALPPLARRRQDARTCSTTSNDKRGLGLSTAGLLIPRRACSTHARALAAICAPTVNSYKRLVVGRSLSGATWAPAYIAYGDNNRTALRAHSRRPPRVAAARWRAAIRISPPRR